MSVLLLKFSAPMQAWGTETKLNDHHTDPYPSKSGIVGMIAASMGRKRDESVEDIAALSLGIRVNKPGIIISDFQSAAIRDLIWEDIRQIKDSRKYIGTRYFLSDAEFLVALEGDRDILEILAYNLNHPAYPLYFGRRGFPVNADLVVGVFDESIEQALKSHGYQNGMRIVVEAANGGEMVHDVPVSFDFRKRTWGYRIVREI